ncbi:UvrD-helicase domain-containing protein [Parabacteroides sp. PF5-6]|uniref:ATP-dependent helicase n=1 Tax=Parabacteroides sp. PF5-6 TaxID=1742403 RepID=UPI0024076090|nr:UvrD-helicase domain-containing protein [Parabacteroides sp. PF5-6]MDF9829602.1 DNA helicase-2/ATP-dependent DNA helicase PcrA [Parabacteroides sp. PF5-6]
MEEYLKQLNESQRAAVTYTDGPSLVIAGAGSGKTRVLTYKIAYLLNKGIPPYAILALTFTNKAAREMKERIATIVGEPTARRLWMGTFHSIFARILRSEAEFIGYPSHFTIYDSADSKSLIKAIIKEMQLDDKLYRPGMVQSRISNAKNALITARAYEHNKDLVEYDIKAKVPLIRDVYKRYESRCRQAGAMDFDDLLLQTNILFRDHPAVLDKYRQFFRHILVDEYQDTNFAQHLIVQRLSEGHGQLTVVGDDAQSIYSFRGANIDNILQLKRVYPTCRTFKLERNYRSTQNIVNAANSLIHKNKEQIHKTVYSEKEQGDKLLAFSTYSDYEEGYAVASKIDEMRRKRNYEYADFAILYRTNAQSRILEEALRKRGIPYKIYGGLSFYQRKEIKDVIAYFRLIVNPHDEEALKRVINYPARGIGDTTVGKLIAAASERGVSLWSVLKEPLEYAVKINNGTAQKLNTFRELIGEFITYSQENPAEETAAHIVKQSGIYSSFLVDQSVEGISRRENLEELLKGIAEFVQIRREEGLERVSIADFLSEVALLTDQDNDKEEQANKVTLMTVHAAKGLEFRNVFVVGLEEDLFPSMMAKDSMRAIEEERRLFYVAITRAEENCILSYAKSRFRNGKTSVCSPSRFLRDIDTQFVELPEDPAARADSFDSERERYGARPAFQSPFQQRRAAEEPVQIVKPTPPPARMRKVEATASPASASLPSASQADVHGLQVGTRVSHDRFGEGEVTAIEGEGGNAKATVVFQHFGQKQLLLKFAKLTILSP